MKKLFQAIVNFFKPKKPVTYSPKVEDPLKDVPFEDTLPTGSNITNMILAVARAEVGVRESGGNNKGKRVQEYQSVIGKAESEPWCLSFIQWVALKVCQELFVKNPLHPTEHCYTLWNKTPTKYRLKDPKAGAIMVQVTRAKGKTNGHVGICTGVKNAAGIFPTIEGNTNSAGSREGDGVYQKTRSVNGNLSMEVKGFIDLPKMIEDLLD